MTKKPLLTILYLAVLTSCSFNNAFLKPTKIIETAKKASVKTETDTTVFSFAGETYQPTVTQKNGEPAILDYTIESVIFKSADGNKINGWFLRPKNVLPKVTLLHLHGNEGSLLNQYQAISHY